jgi:glycosyltransferase involved in cell wall biosynthesis
MKICYLTHDIDPGGGWGRYASDLINGVKNLGHEVVVLKEQDDHLFGEAVLKRGWGLFHSVFKVIGPMRGCDVIHALDVYPYGIIAYLANIFLNKKFIITAQGTYSIAPFYNIKTKFLSKLACCRANLVIAISSFTKQELLRIVKVKKIEVINHGINFEKFYKEHINSEEKFILSVGALKFRKGYHISIPAFALAKNKIPDLKYKIVGNQSDKNYFNLLKNLCSQYKVEKDVEFITGISDVQLSDLYSMAKIFVLTSVNDRHHIEGFGLVFLEAAACGDPVLGTTGNGIVDAIHNNINGILVDQNDIQKTSDAIVSIIADSKKFKNFSNASYKWAQDHDIKIVVSKYIDIYKNLINRPV